MKTMILKKFIPGLTVTGSDASQEASGTTSVVIMKIWNQLKPVLLAFVGIGMFLLFWEGISVFLKREMPGPAATLSVLYDMLVNPFYDYGPNDKGIGLQLWYSMVRVAMGFGLATVFAIPIGMLLGAS